MLINLIVVLGYVSVAWAISAILRRADVIDAFWAPGFIVVSVATLLQADTQPVVGQRVLLAAVLIWGLRLGWHLTTRWWGEQHEDRRYAALRAAGSDLWWLRSLVTVFCFQGLIMWVVALPLQWALFSDQTGPPALLAAGVVLWVIGFCFEAVGDRQLTAFRRDPQNVGTVLRTGLWRYTRHPNYFGDFLVWWGLFCISLSCGAPAWTVISPVIMSVFLMKFSGVGPLESDIASRRPGYAEYVNSTSTFFPLPPRSQQTTE